MLNLTEISILKSRSGVYQDTPKNRRLHRVGMKYGAEKKQDDPEADKKPKGQEEQPEQPKKERNGDSVKRELELLEEHKDSIVEKYGEKAYNKKVESLKKEGEDFEQKETVKELKERADKEDAEKAKKEEEKKKDNGPEKKKQQKDKNGISILEEGYSGDLTEVPNDGRKVLTAVDEDGRELAIFMNGRGEITVANEYTTYTTNRSFYQTLEKLLRNFQDDLNISDKSLKNIVKASEESFTESDKKEAEKKKDWRPTKSQPYIEDGKITKRDVRRAISEMDVNRILDMADNYPLDTASKKELKGMKNTLEQGWKRVFTGSDFDSGSKRNMVVRAIEEFENKIDAALQVKR